MNVNVQMKVPRSYGDIEDVAEQGNKVAAEMAAQIQEYAKEVGLQLSRNLGNRVGSGNAEQMVSTMMRHINRAAAMSQELANAWLVVAAEVNDQRAAAHRASAAADRSGGFRL
jgi:hypothetical protein